MNGTWKQLLPLKAAEEDKAEIQEQLRAELQLKRFTYASATTELHRRLLSVDEIVYYLWQKFSHTLWNIAAGYGAVMRVVTSPLTPLGTLKL